MSELKGSFLPLGNSETNILRTSQDWLVYQERPMLVEGEEYQALYVYSGDPITIGDWIVNLANPTCSSNNIYKCDTADDVITADSSKYWMKLVATSREDLEGFQNILSEKFVEDLLNFSNNNEKFKLHDVEFTRLSLFQLKFK